MEEVKNQIRLLHIVTTEVLFKREPMLDGNYNKALTSIDVALSKSFEEDKISVILKVIFKQTFEEKDLVLIEVTCAGMFQMKDKLEEKALDMFCDVNGPAIIFPFIRETISSLSIKGGLQPILMQPVNFVELAKQNKASK